MTSWQLSDKSEQKKPKEFLSLGRFFSRNLREETFSWNRKKIMNLPKMKNVRINRNINKGTFFNRGESSKSIQREKLAHFIYKQNKFVISKRPSLHVSRLE